ncbi:MAG: hypothetical protein RRC34_16890 [Lentisphaeria bacterium]|nr:hypothetical protein [Lentisphaeria bacterium]
MNNATDTMIGSFFSEEAERIKKRSWTSLWIGFAVAVPCIFMMMAGFFSLLVSIKVGALIMFLSTIGFLVGVAFILRFALLRMKVANYVGSQVRKTQNKP